MFKRIVFLFAWLGIFAMSLASINYILLPGQFIFQYPILNGIGTFEIKMAILIIAGIYLFLCIYKFFSLFERKKDYQKKTENGVLKISRSTINSYVSDLLRKDADISAVKVNSELKGNKFLVYVKCELEAAMNVADKISQVQENVKKSLSENVGVDVNKVIVNISKIAAKEPVKEVVEATPTDNVEVNN